VWVRGSAGNCGQSCIGAKRFIVTAPVYDRFLEGFAAKMTAIKVPPAVKDRCLLSVVNPGELFDRGIICMREWIGWRMAHSIHPPPPGERTSLVRRTPPSGFFFGVQTVSFLMGTFIALMVEGGGGRCSQPHIQPMRREEVFVDQPMSESVSRSVRRSFRQSFRRSGRFLVVGQSAPRQVNNQRRKAQRTLIKQLPKGHRTRQPA